ncbi:hypothetical protein [Curtobacterium sp. CFBP9011]|uniref:hypothetical protein n=1 Tax=Curtobacterium sp. CFBP9011 TaxID=3096530 RepID=UPI002A6A731C|nr:hypothetical protein [Curtobacterium sp. CFBP9011]MDY1005679.1 hypothetical protein [Curtobacterium sp. CFBP9011]
MSIDQDLVTRRWAAADRDAEAVLAEEDSLLRVSAWSRWSLGLGVLALLVVTVGFAVLPRGDDDTLHVVAGLSVVGVALGVVVVRTIQGNRVRGRLGMAYPMVTTVLTSRERQAVQRAVTGRTPVPADRRRVVRAAALLRADLLRVEQPLWYATVWSALVLGAGSSDFPLGALYAVSAVLVLVGAGVVGADVFRVRRVLRAGATPEDAPGSSA